MNRDRTAFAFPIKLPQRNILLRGDMRKTSRKAKGKKPSRVVIVDDHPLVLRGLIEVLNESKGLKVCGQAEKPEDVLGAVDSAKPDLVILDLFLRGILAFDLIKAMRQKYPDMGILVLSVQKESHFAERALRAGADGYITKEEASQEIREAVRTVLAGKTYLSGLVQASMLHRVDHADERNLRAYVCKLSDRELQVFKMLGEGLFPRQIALELGANLKTIETYCGRIKKKLRLCSGTELARLAIQWRALL